MSTPQTTRRRLNCHSFLKLAAAVGVTAAGGYALFEYAPWLDHEQQARQTRRPFDRNSAGAAQMLEMIRYATLPANGHNTQPWLFSIKENAIEIRPDYARRLPIVDPDDRELWISLGCVLEYLPIFARATGYIAEVVYPESDDFILVHLAVDTPQNGPFSDAIPQRQNTRSDCDGHPDDTGLLDQLVNLPLEPGVMLRLVTSPADFETVVEYVSLGDLRQCADRAFVEELISWLRSTKRVSFASLDGLYTGSSGNQEVPRLFSNTNLTLIEYGRQKQDLEQVFMSMVGAITMGTYQALQPRQEPR